MQKLSMKQKRFGIMVIIPALLIIASAGFYEHNAYAQDFSSLANISMTAVLSVVVVGLIGTTLQAYQGWSTSGEKFNAKSFLDRVLLGAVHSIWMAFVAAAGFSSLTPIAYMFIFFSVVGVTELSMKQLSNSALGSGSSPAPSQSQLPPPPGQNTIPAPQQKTAAVGDTIIQA